MILPIIALILALVSIFTNPNSNINLFKEAERVTCYHKITGNEKTFKKMYSDCFLDESGQLLTREQFDIEYTETFAGYLLYKRSMEYYYEKLKEL